MSYEEKRELVSIASALVIIALYAAYVLHQFPVGGWRAASPAFWASSLLIMVPVMVIPQIIIMIIFSIFIKLTTGEEEPDSPDEMERLIELKSLRNSYYFFIIGFFAALLTLALGWPMAVMFISFGGALIGAGIFGLTSKLFYYRRGL